MTASAHALVGGAIAASVANPALGLTLATVSHPLLDIVPHWDLGWGWRDKSKVVLLFQSVGDLVFGTVLSYFIFYSPEVNIWYFFLAILLSTGWDIAEGPYLLFNWRFPPFSWVYRFQSDLQGKLALPWGLVIQVVAVVLIYGVLQILPLR
jgi:membrane-bound metal-dependent hydrolase YbcI (DUF457 family)